jgi:3-hydroxyisobutyrate dehydrogenase-like beta-hydroxyacid dehydrogenase
MKKVGIIGAGIMAAGMAQNFLKHGHDVYIWNRTKEHVEDLLASGAEWRASPKAVAAAADITIECVTDDEASREVWTNPKSGILAGAHQDGVYIAASTLSLEWTDELAKLCAAQGLGFLDMPLTGSRAGAEGGTLRLMIGGDDAVLDSVRSDLSAISEKIYHFGLPGMGMRFKLLLNMLIAIHVDAAAQVIALGKRAGLDVEAMQHALFDGGMGPSSPATGMVFKSLDTPAEHVNFASRWMEKDLHYAQAMAKHYGMDLNLLNDAAADYALANAAGYADQDLTKIARIYQGK